MYLLKSPSFSLLSLGTLLVGVTISGSSAAETQSRIVGGQLAAPGQFPYIASLHDASINDAKQSAFCSGVLISPDWVLTAAHCVHGIPDGELEVALGHTSLASTPRRKAAWYEMHPGYLSQNDDVALVRLETPVNFTPVALLANPDGSDEVAGTTTTTIGWGATTPFGDDRPSRLSYVEQPLLSRSDCGAVSQDLFLPPFEDQFICAGEGNELGACYGDSGGPLIVDGPGGQPVLIGLTSYGNFPCGSGPTFYARVSQYTGPGGWIEACMTGDDACQNGGTHTCDNGDEIPESWVCDGAEDCLDGGDELNCPGPSFFCGDGSEIPATSVCDDHADCPEGEDEDPELCESLFICDDGTPIPIDYVCDFEPDCPGGEDEVDCGGFVCNDGTVIPEDWVCDTESDCPGGEDEDECEGHYFVCDDGSVIPDDFVCDRYDDCEKGEDEADELCLAPADLGRVDPEPPGANCPAGGYRIAYGRDHNRDGVLSEEEFTTVDYLCNDGDRFTQVSDEPAGDNCEEGGTRLESGVDRNADGTLTADEIEQVHYICNAGDASGGESGGEEGGKLPGCTARANNDSGWAWMALLGLVGLLRRRPM